jgi:hypothetical protein
MKLTRCQQKRATAPEFEPVDVVTRSGVEVLGTLDKLSQAKPEEPRAVAKSISRARRLQSPTLGDLEARPGVRPTALPICGD